MQSIILTETAGRLASAVANLRAVESEWYGRVDVNGYAGGYGALDLLAARAELSLVVLYRERYGENLPWGVWINLTNEELKAGGDVAGMHVRGTNYSTGHLIIRRGDPAGRYVLAIVEDDSDVVRLPGYYDFDGSDIEGVRYDDAGNGRPPCWWVPQDLLVEWP